MQLNEFIDEVYERVGVDRKDPMVTEETCRRAINSGLQKISLIVDWPWLQRSVTFTTTATDTYDTPGDWRKTRHIVDPNGSRLDRYDRGQLDDRWTGTETGMPREYAIEADKIVLRPVPTVGLELTHRYLRREERLEQSSDSPLLPDEFSNAVVEYAAGQVLRKVRRYSDANVATALYQSEIVEMRDDRRRAIGPGRPRVRPGSFF